MPTPLQVMLGFGAAASAVTSANFNDRKAKELRSTAEQRYKDPYISRGRAFSRRKSDLEFNHEQRFPQSSTRRTWRAANWALCIFVIALLISMVSQRPMRTNPTQPSQITDR